MKSTIFTVVGVGVPGFLLGYFAAGGNALLVLILGIYLALAFSLGARLGGAR